MLSRTKVEYGSLQNAEKIKINEVEDKFFVDISKDFPLDDQNFNYAQSNFFSQFWLGQDLNQTTLSSICYYVIEKGSNLVTHHIL